jgi:hypothetical protein
MSVSRGPEPEPPVEPTCDETPDGLEYTFAFNEPAEVSVSFTVTNDFTPAPTTTAPTTTAPPAAAPEAAPAPAPPVAAQPTFTG